MRKLSLFIAIMFVTGFAIGQNSADVSQLGDTQTATVVQEGAGQFTKVFQQGIANDVLVEQISANPQSAWVVQSGEMKDKTTGIITPGGEDNHATVDQKYAGNGNKSFLYQFGSFNKSSQTQKGNNNKFNITGNFPQFSSNLQALPTDIVPNQDGDYHEMTQTANGDDNQAWLYQAGRKHIASQVLNGNENEVWTSQSGNTNKSYMSITGNKNGSHYMVHEEGKFPEPEGGTDEGTPVTGGNGNQGGNGGQGDGGMPDVIPPPHDESHVFVPTVGVSIKQMGRNSVANMNIHGNDNKATIIQRGGSGGNDTEQAGHYAKQDITGDYNRIFANQTGTANSIDQYVNGYKNLVLLMQKGNGGISTIDLTGDYNDIGVDQKGKSNFSRIMVEGDWNGNFNASLDEYGVKLAQEGKGNHSEMDITGNYNFVNAHQGGGGISTITQTGDYNSAIVNQEGSEE